jgi:signal transduction histidine kinase
VVRSLGIFLSLICFIHSGYAQNLARIDSLKKVIPQTNGVDKFERINELAWEYRFAYPDSTMHFAEQAYALGKQLNLTSGLAKPINFMGIALNYKGERLKAYEYYSNALDIAAAQKDSVQIAHSNNNIGRLFFEQGILSRSYEYFLEAMEIFKSIEDKSGVAYSLQSMANLYRTQKDYTKSEDSYIEAYNIRAALGNPRDIMSALVQLGRVYQEMEEWDKAIVCFIRADSAGNVIKDEINLAEIKMFLAVNYLQQKKLMEAEKIAHEGFVVIQRNNNVRMLPEAHLTLGQIQLAKSNLAKAKEHFKAALDVSIRTKELAPQMDAYFYLWEVSKMEKNKQEELSNLNQYLILKDSIKDLDLARQVERLQFQLEIEQKEKENELLKINRARNEATIQQQRIQNILLVIVLISVSAFGFMLWINNKKRKEANERLETQKKEIEKQREEIIRQNENLSRRNQELFDINHEKDTIMSIVAHDLKSPLNRIKGLSDLLELEGGLSAEQKNYISMVKDATQSGLDLITDLLDVNMLEENVELNYSSFDLSNLLCEKVEAFRPAAEAKNIHLQIYEADVGRIIDNLLSNAIKFSRKNSNVKIGGGGSSESFWISVKDQGPGFSQKDRELIFQKFRKLSARPTGGESSNGLGLAIVKTLIDRLGGRIELKSDPGMGSEFLITLPHQKVSAEA